MSKTIRQFRDALSVKTPEDTFAELQGWLSAGDRNIMRSLGSIKRNQSVQRLRVDLSQFIAQVEKESPRLTQFLFHYHSGNEAFQEKRWEEAREHLVAAIALHQPEYLALKMDLERKLTLIANQVNLENLVEKGSDAYLKKEWQTSMDAFQQAKRLYYPGCQWQIEEFDQVIANSKKALAVQRHLAQAKVAQQQSQWKVAIQELQMSLSSHFPDSEFRIEEIQEEIRWSQSQLNAVQQDQASDRPAMVVMRRYLLPVLLLGVLLTIVWLFFDQQERFLMRDSSLTEGIASREGDLTDPLIAAPSDAVEEGDLPSADVPSFFEEEEPISLRGIDPNLSLPDAFFTIGGELKAQSAINVFISGFDPTVKYTMDFGNGIKIPVTNGQQYSYPAAGTFQMVLLATSPDGQKNKSARVVTIDPGTSFPGSESASTTEVVAEELPAAPVVSVKPETVYVAIPPTPAPATVAPAKPAEPTQKPVAKPAPITGPLDMAEQMPAFPGGESAMFSYLQSKLQYPPLAKEREVEGTVYLRFVVEADGRLTGFRVLRGLGYGCDEEALRIAKSMPRWKPGAQQGAPVPVYYTLPIKFIIP
ncbi:MAG: TonB family protein [Bacteroidia bacterium]|nr:TonB family protein [Bacteroidia bacterium]